MNPDDDALNALNALREEVASLRRSLDMLQARVDQLESGASPGSAPPKPVPSPPPIPAAFPKPAPSPEVYPAPVFPRTAAAESLGKSPPKPVARPEPSAVSRLIDRAKAAVGPAPGQSMEIYLTTRLLPVVAVLVIGTGVVFLAVLALQVFRDAWWMPYARLALGYVIAAGLLFGGARMRKVSESYGGLLFGSGMALTYFVTFATHFLPFARVFSRPEPTLALLAGVVIAWGAVAHFRDSRRTALSMTLLGHFTVALSTAYTVPPSSLGVLGIVALSLGSAWFMARKGWFLVGFAGMLCAYGNHLYYLVNSPASTSVTAFVLAFSIAVVYFLIFATAEFVRSMRGDDALKYRSRTLFVSLNTAAFLLIASGTFTGFAFARPQLHMLYFGTAAAMILAGMAHRARPGRDLLYNAYFTKASIVGTIGLALYFEGTTLALSIALEAVALLVSARVGGTVVSRILSYCTGLLAFLLAAAILLRPDIFHIGSARELSVAVPVGLTALVFHLAALLHHKTDWRAGQIDEGTIWPRLRGVARQLDLVRHEAAGVTRNGEIISTLYALAGAVLAVLAGWRCASGIDAQYMLATLALVATGTAVLLRARPLATASIFTTVAAPVFLWAYAMSDAFPGWGNEFFSIVQLKSALALAALLALGELHFRRRDHAGVWPAGIGGGDAGGLNIVHGLSIAATGWFVILGHHAPVYEGLICAAYAGAAALYAATTSSRAFRLPILLWVVGTAALLKGLLLQFDVGISTHALTVAILLAVAIMSEPRWVGDRAWMGNWRQKGAPYFVYLSIAAIYALYPHQFGVYLGLGALAAGLSVVVLHPKAVAWSGVLLLSLAMAEWPDLAPEAYSLALLATPVILFAGALAGDYWLIRRRVFILPVANVIMLAAALILAMRYTRTFAGADAFYPWWGIVAAVFLGYMALGRSRPAGAIGGIFLIASTLLLVQASFTRELAASTLIFAYGVHIALYLSAERAFSSIRPRVSGTVEPEAPSPLRAILAGTPVALAVLLMAALPTLSSYYLTISWSVVAVCTFGVAAFTREACYRYAALCVLALAVLRVTFVDVRQLGGIYRIMAWIFLGIVLLGVAHAYTVSRGKAKNKKSASPGGDAENR